MDDLSRLHARYRATGADLPFGHPERAHDVAMEGYFWRITDPGSGRVVIALIGVNRGPRGPWATVALATSTGPGQIVDAALDGAWAASRGLAAGSGQVFLCNDRLLRVRLSNGTLDAQLTHLDRWPHRLWGGSSVFQAVPGLNQYWHPWLLNGGASGMVELNGDRPASRPDGVERQHRTGRPGTRWIGSGRGRARPSRCRLRR
jgi:tocopherol cyclase